MQTSTNTTQALDTAHTAWAAAVEASDRLAHLMDELRELLASVPGAAPLLGKFDGMGAAHEALVERAHEAVDLLCGNVPAGEKGHAHASGGAPGLQFARPKAYPFDAASGAWNRYCMNSGLSEKVRQELHAVLTQHLAQMPFLKDAFSLLRELNDLHEAEVFTATDTVQRLAAWVERLRGESRQALRVVR